MFAIFLKKPGRLGILNEEQQVYAEMADIIISAVAKVGIIALIDEATD